MSCASRSPATVAYDPEFWAAFDPVLAYDIWSTQASRIVYDGLVALQYSSADAQVMVPDLADAVPTPTDGGRTYIFNLRPGIRYSTGAEVRASDFELGVQRALYYRPRRTRPRDRTSTPASSGARRASTTGRPAT